MACRPKTNREPGARGGTVHPARLGYPIQSSGTVHLALIRVLVGRHDLLDSSIKVARLVLPSNHRRLFRGGRLRAQEMAPNRPERLRSLMTDNWSPL